MTERGQLRWRKSSRSSNTGANCVEVAVRWRKSSRSDNTGANCVEVANALPGWAVRDSKNASGPHLVFEAAPSTAFLRALKADHLTG